MIHLEPPLYVCHAKFAVGILLPKDLGPAIAVPFDNRYLRAVFQGTDDVVSVEGVLRTFRLLPLSV